MNTFLSTFILFYSVYGTAHVYAFLKVKYTFYPGLSGSVYVGLFLVFMMFSPSLMRFCSIRLPERLPRTIAYMSYAWMALLLFFFACGLVLDIYNLILFIFGHAVQMNLAGLSIPAQPAFFIPVLLSIPLSIYSYYEAKSLRASWITIKTPKLPEGTGKLTVAHISDLHLGVMVKDEMLDKIAAEIKKIKPDIIVSTGDLLEEEVKHITHLSEKLKKLEARLGKFAVTGNHDFYTDISQSVNFMKNSGFTPLRDEQVTVENIINIAGIDDPLVKYIKGSGNRPSEKEILSGSAPGLFTILLKHRPDIEKDSLGLFDLQLSGHTHGGQFMPIRIILKLLYGYKSGYRSLPKGSAIHVSPGAGTACSPIRFLARPEITFIEIEREDNDTF